ncbi:MAG: UbiX family flavin prenyltransferase [Saprospiraceae bacterium]
MNNKIILAISGSSGSIYAKLLMDKLAVIKDLTVGVIISDNAKINMKIELGNFDLSHYPFTFYGRNDFMAPFASGSAQYHTMIICPCSMGVIGRISSGVSSDLTTRAADVILKERRKLIVVPRETPYSNIHLKNMLTLTNAGAIICPASPSFYNKPKSIDELCLSVIDRIMDLANLPVNAFRWGQ